VLFLAKAEEMIATLGIPYHNSRVNSIKLNNTEEIGNRWYSKLR
jgi:hypothetical protein